MFFLRIIQLTATCIILLTGKALTMNVPSNDHHQGAWQQIDILIQQVTENTNPFNRRMPTYDGNHFYDYTHPYPQLLAQALHATDHVEITRTVRLLARNDRIADRSLGSLIGLIAGDSVGAPLEFLPTQTTHQLISIINNNEIRYEQTESRFDLSPGQWTDDSSMALCLADSLIISHTQPGGYNGSDCRLRYYLWWTANYNNAFVYDNRRINKHSIGLGGNIGTSFQEIRQNPQAVPPIFNSNRNDAGNGSIMRNAPIPIRFSGNLQSGVRAAIRQSKATHPGEDAAACCVFMTYITSQAIRRAENEITIQNFLDQTIERFVEDIANPQINAGSQGFVNLTHVLNAQPLSPREAMWNWRLANLPIEETLRNRGQHYNGYPVLPGYFGSYCMDGLAMALWALNGATSFETAIMRCINLCGDADSTGAICGQIAGAFYGYNAMQASPAAHTMITNIQRWDPLGEIEIRALMLYRLGMQEEETRFNQTNIMETISRELRFSNKAPHAPWWRFFTNESRYRQSTTSNKESRVPWWRFFSNEL
jgi:ADP-ribosyl-[dinitrogen reductase] hydrolase